MPGCRRPPLRPVLACPAGAPQNHWFGPAGDPRAAGIGTPEAIRLVWSTHRWGVLWELGQGLIHAGHIGCRSSSHCWGLVLGFGADMGVAGLLLLSAGRSSKTLGPCRMACICCRAEQWPAPPVERAAATVWMLH